MSNLINKGGFRERANRYRQYQESENHKTSLDKVTYQPTAKNKANPDCESKLIQTETTNLGEEHKADLK